MYIQSPAGLIQPRIDHLVGAHFLKSVFFCWGDSLYKNTSINTNCNPPPQTYYQLPTKICHHRALSLESAVNVRSVEGRCTDPASICSHKSCAFVLNLEFHIRQQGISTTVMVQTRRQWKHWLPLPRWLVRQKKETWERKEEEEKEEEKTGRPFIRGRGR